MKGHKYLTLVYQIDEGCKRLLWIGRERTETRIDPTGWAEIGGEAFAPGFFVMPAPESEAISMVGHFTQGSIGCVTACFVLACAISAVNHGRPGWTAASCDESRIGQWRRD